MFFMMISFGMEMTTRNKKEDRQMNASLLFEETYT